MIHGNALEEQNAIENVFTGNRSTEKEYKTQDARTLNTWFSVNPRVFLTCELKHGSLTHTRCNWILQFLLLEVGEIFIVTVAVEVVHVGLVSTHPRHHGGHVHSSHAAHTSSQASHVLHHLLKVATTSTTFTLSIAVILVLPLAKVDLEPMLLGLLSQKPLPVWAFLRLLQGKLDAPGSHLVLGRLRIHLLQKLHVQLKSCLVSSSVAFEKQGVFLHLDLWVLDVRHIDCEEDDLRPLSPRDTWGQDCLGGHRCFPKFVSLVEVNQAIKA